jgi:hypothetical protein
MNDDELRDSFREAKEFRAKLDAQEQGYRDRVWASREEKVRDPVPPLFGPWKSRFNRVRAQGHESNEISVGNIFLALVGLMFIAVISGHLPSLANILDGWNTSPSPDRSVVVAGARKWTNSHVELVKGQRVEITADGLVQFYPGILRAPMGPDGDGSNCSEQDAQAGRFLAAQLPCHSLVGRISDGPAFEIGRGLSFVAPRAGQLWLGVNDNVFGDNSGSWTVRIYVEH